MSYDTATIKEDLDLENAVRFARLLGSNVTGDATGSILNRIDRRFTQEQLTFGIHNHYFKGEKFASESPQDVLSLSRDLPKLSATQQMWDILHLAPCANWDLV